MYIMFIYSLQVGSWVVVFFLFFLKGCKKIESYKLIFSIIPYFTFSSPLFLSLVFVDFQANGEISSIVRVCVFSTLRLWLILHVNTTILFTNIITQAVIHFSFNGKSMVALSLSVFYSLYLLFVASGNGRV